MQLDASGRQKPDIGNVTIQDVTSLKEQNLFETLISNQAFWVTVALAIICVVMSLLQPDAFASTENFYNITRNFAFIGIMSVGMVAVAIAGGLLAGAALGTVNGVLIAYVGLSPFVVTLGMLSLGRSLAVVLSQNRMIYKLGPGGPIFTAIGGGNQILGIANPVWVLLAVAIVF